MARELEVQRRAQRGARRVELLESARGVGAVPRGVGAGCGSGGAGARGVDVGLPWPWPGRCAPRRSVEASCCVGRGRSVETLGGGARGRSGSRRAALWAGGGPERPALSAAVGGGTVSTASLASLRRAREAPRRVRGAPAAAAGARGSRSAPPRRAAAPRRPPAAPGREAPPTIAQPQRVSSPAAVRAGVGAWWGGREVVRSWSQAVGESGGRGKVGTSSSAM